VVAAHPHGAEENGFAGGPVSASSNTVDACVTVTSLSTPSEPMMKPASSSPVIDTLPRYAATSLF
jgi:hypothetical protein